MDRGKRTWLGAAAVLGLLCLPTALAVDDFEAGSGYVLGNINGQQGWQVTTQAGGATAEIIIDPHNPSNWLVRIRNHDGTGGNDGEIRFRKALNLGVSGPMLVTVSYDLEYVAAAGANSLRPRVYDDDGMGGYWPICGNMHYDGGGGTACHQHYASRTPDGMTGNWELDGSPCFNAGGSRFNTSSVYYYSGTNSGSHLVKFVVNGVDYPKRNAYTVAWNNDPSHYAIDVDYIDFRLPSGGGATWFIDNLEIVAVPCDPAPVADAGEYPDVIPGSYDGGVVDADGCDSTPAADIVKYQWTMPDSGGSIAKVILSEDPFCEQTIALPNNQTTTVLLNVFREDGVYHSDTAQITVGPAQPIPSDNVQTFWGIVFGDIYGTSASATLPLLVSEDKPFKVLNQVTYTAWDPTHNHFPVFDRLGNLYYIRWDGVLVSLNKNLQLRWTGNSGGSNINTHGTGTSSVIVGGRYVYVAGRDDVDLPTVYFFDKVTGNLVWFTTLTGPGGWPVERPSFRPKMTLYDNKLYIVGEVGVEAPFECRIYQVDTTTFQQDGSSRVAVEMADIGMGGQESNPGNLVLVPNAFGTGLHGLYWNQCSFSGGLDFVADMAGIKLNPANATATTVWGAYSLIDGPYLWRSHVMYSPQSNILYTPSYNDWGTSLYAWKPVANNGQQLAGTVSSDLGGNHGHADVSAIDTFTPGVTKVHSHSNGGEIVTYIDNLGNGTSFTVEKRSFDVGGGYHFARTGVLLYDDETDPLNPRSVLITGINHEWPGRIVAIDLTAPPVEPDPNMDDGPIYFDNIVIKQNGVPVFSENFEAPRYQPGDLVSSEAPWVDDNWGNPQDYATVVALDGGQVARMNPYGTNADDWTRVYAALGVQYPTVGNAIITIEWDQWRHDLTDNSGIYTYGPNNSCGFGVFQWDLTKTAYAYDDPCNWGTDVPLKPRAWQHVVMTLNFAAHTYVVSVDGVATDPMNLATGYVFDTFYLGYEATPPYTAPQNPYIAEWIDPNPGTDPENGFGWPERGPVVGPDGTVYFLQYAPGYQNRFTRLGAETVTNPCEGQVLGDANCDGNVDGFDIQPFVLALTNPSAWEAIYGPLGCDLLCVADCNGSGTVDGFDIQPFVQILVGG